MVKVWWQYLTMFIVALIAGASFTILTFSPKDTILETSATGKVVTSIMNARDAEVDFNLAFEDEDISVKADGTFVMDLNEETNALNFDVKLNLLINQTNATIHFSYCDDIIYFALDDQSLKFAASNLSQNLNAVMAMVMPLVKDIKLPFDISSISMDKLQSLVTIATEKKFEDHYEVCFPLDEIILGLGTAVIEADLDYNPTKVYLRPTEKDVQTSFKLAFSATTNLVKESISVKPTEEQLAYTDMTNLVSLASTLLGTLKENTLSFDAEANIEGITLNSDVCLSLSPLLVQADFNLLGGKANLVYQNDKAYFNLFGIKVMADKNFLTSKLNGIIPDEAMAISTTNMDIKTIFGALKEFDINKLSTLVEKETIVTLQNNEEITRNIYSLNALGYNIKFIASEEKLETVEVTKNGDTLPFVVLKTKESKIEVLNIDESMFVPIETVIEKLEFAKNLINEKKASGEIALSYKNYNYVFNFEADLSSSLKLRLSTNILNNNLIITYVDETVFVKYDGIEVYGNFGEVNQMIDNIKTFVSSHDEINQAVLGICEFVLENVDKKISSIQVPPQNELISNILKEITLNSEKLEATLQNGLIASLNFLSSQENEVEITYQDFTLAANVEVDKTLNITKPENYSNIKDLEPVLNFIEDLYENKALSGNITFNAFGEQVNLNYQIKLDPTNLENSSAQLETSLFGSKLTLTYLNKVLFVEYKDMAISITYDEITNILSQTGILGEIQKAKDEALSINIFDLIKTDRTFADLEILNEFLGEKEMGLVNALADLFVSNINALTLNFNENGINIALNNKIAKVAYSAGSVSSIEVMFDDYNILLTDLSCSTNITAPTNAVTYAKLVSILNNIKSYVENKQFAFNVKATYDNTIYDLNLKLDLNDGLKLNAQTTYDGININLTIIKEDVYITAERNGKAYSFKASLNDVESVLDIVSNYVSLDKQSILNIIDSIKPYLNNPVTSLENLIKTTNLPEIKVPEISLKDVMQLVNTNKDLTLSLNEAENNLMFNASFNDLSVEANFDESMLTKLLFESNKTIVLDNKPINIENFELTRKEFSNITAPTNFVDTKNFVKLYNAVLNTIKEQKLSTNFEIAMSGNVEININGINLALPVNFGIKAQNNNINAYVQTEFKGAKVSLVLNNETIYADIAGLKIKVETNKLEDVLSFVLEKLQNDELTQKVQSFKQINVQEELNALINSTSLDSVLDFVFTQLNFNLTNTSLNVQTYGVDVDLTFNETLQSINGTYANNSVVLDFIPFDMPEINQSSFVNIENYIELANNTLEMIEMPYFAGNVDISYNNHTYSIAYELNTEQKIVHLQTNILNLPLEVYLTENEMFVSIAGQNFCGSIEDAQEILNSLNFVLPNINITEMLEEMKTQINTTISSYDFDFDNFNLTNYVLSLTNTQNNITAVLSDDIHPMLNGAQIVLNTENNTLGGIEILAQNISGRITVLAGNNTISVPTNFNSIKHLTPTLNFVKDLYENKALSGNITFNAFGEQVNLNYQLKVDPANLENSSAQLETSLFGSNLRLTYLNKILFVEYKDMAVSITYDEITSILSQTGILGEIQKAKDEALSINIFDLIKTDKTFADLEILNEFLGEKEMGLVNAIADMIVSNINALTLNFNENGINIAFENKLAQVVYSGGVVSSVKVMFDEYDVLLSDLSFTTNITAPTNAVTYAKLVSIFSNIKSYVENKQFAFNVKATYDNTVYELNLKLDLNDGLKLNAQTTYDGVNIDLTIIKEDVYITAERNGKAYSFKASLNDVESVLDIVSNYVSLDKESILNIIDSIKPYLNNPVTSLENLIKTTNLPEIEVPEISLKDVMQLINTNKDLTLSLNETENNLMFNASFNDLSMEANFDESMLTKLLFESNKTIVLDNKPITIKNFELTRKDFSNITAPTNFVDTKNFVKLYNAVLNTIKEQKLSTKFEIAMSGNVEINTNKINLALPVNFGIKTQDGNIYAYVQTEFKGAKVSLVLNNETIYANIAGLKIKVETNKLEDVLSFVLEKLQNEELTQKVENMKQLDVQEELNAITSNTSIDDVLNFVFTQLNFNLTNTSLNVQTYGVDVDLTFNETLQSINGTYANNSVVLDFIPFDMPEINQSSFVNIENYIELANNTLEMIEMPYFAGNAEISYNNHAYSIAYELNTEQKIVHITTTILNLPLEIFVTENEMFVSIAGQNFCGSIEDAQEILNSLNFVLPNINITEMLEDMKTQINTTISSYDFDFDNFNLTNYVLSLTNTQNNITAVLSDNIHTMLNGAQIVLNTENNTLGGVEIVAQNISGRITVLAGNNTISVPTNFNAIKHIVPVLNFVKDLYENKALSGNITFNAFGEEVNLNYQIKLDPINLENSSAQIETSLFGSNLRLTYLNKVLFVEYKDMVVSITYDEITNILSQTGILGEIQKAKDEALSINIFDLIKTDKTFADLEILNEFLGEKEMGLVNALANLFVSNINALTLNFNENGINIAINDKLAQVVYNNGIVSSIEVAFDDYNILLTDLSCNTNITAPTNAVTYAKLMSIANNIKSYVENKQFAFNVKATYDNIIYDLNLKLDLNDGLKLNAQTTYDGINIDLTIIKEDVYITAERNGKAYSFKANLNDIESVLDIVSNYVNLDKTSILNIIDGIKPYLNAPINEIEKLIDENKPKLTEELNKTRSLKEILELLNTNLNFNLKLLESENNLVLSGEYEDYNIALTFDDIIQSLKASTSGFVIDNQNINLTNIELNVLNFDEISVLTSYIDLKDVLKLYDALSVILDDQALAGSGQVTFDLFGNQTTININYQVQNGENGLNGFVETTLNGILIRLTIVDNTIYFDMAGAKVSLQMSELDDLLTWVNNNFGLTLPSNFDLESIVNSKLTFDGNILDIIFNDIQNFTLANNMLSIQYKNICLDLEFGDVIKTIMLNFNGISFELNSQKTSELDFSGFNNSNFVSYTVLTNFVESALKTIENKQFNVNAIVDVFRGGKKAFNGNINLTADIKNNLSLGGVGILSNPNSSEKYEVYLSFLNDYLYVSYNNLKLSASRSSLKDLLTIALSVLGIDPESVGILGSIDDDMHFDTTNLDSVLPEFDMANPFDLLKYIERFVITENSFGVVVKGSEINSNVASDKFITVLINHNQEEIQSITFKNIFTGVSDTEYFDMTVNFNKFTQVTGLKFAQTSYIDISNSSSLLKALLNTTKLTDYHITATADVHINAISIINVTKTVNFDARIKNEDGNITAMVKISKIPVLAKVTDDKDVASILEFVSVLAGSDTKYSRDLTVYFKDGYIYIYREDYKTSDHSITSKDCVKLRPSVFLSDIGYYLMDYGIGFTDSIMEEINKSIEKTKNRSTPMDISNVLKSYSYNQSQKKHSITINMEEVTANTDLKDMTIGIYTINNASTENKDYLYKLDFVLNMAFASVVSMDISTTDMTLTQIGSPVDVSNANSYANSYSYAENAEMTYNGSSWSNTTPSTTYTAVFNTNGGNAMSNITAKAGTNLNLNSRIPTKNTVDNGVTRTTYTFAGWFDNSSLSGEAYSGTMPRGGIVLYAKWIENTNEYKNINLISALSGNQTIKKLIGDSVSLPDLGTIVEDNGISRKTHTFAGWFDENGNNININSMPNENLTLYAHFDAVEEFYSTISFVTQIGETPQSITKLIGESISLPIINTVVVDDGISQITHTFAGWKNAQNEIVNLDAMPSVSQTLYAVFNTNTKYYHTISFNTNQSTITEETVSILEGETIVLPTYSPIAYTQGDESIKHTFVGWFVDSGLTTEFNETTMPQTNVVLFAKWNTEIVCSLKIYDNGELIINAFELVGTKVELIDADKDTELYENENFTGTKIIPICENNKYYVEVTKTQTLYVRKTYNFTVNYNSSDKQNVSLKLYANESISSYFVNLNNKTTTRSTYNTDTNFMGYDQTPQSMPKHDLTVNAIWQEVNWINVSFVTTFAKPSFSKGTAVTGTSLNDESVGSLPTIQTTRFNLNSNNEYQSNFTNKTGSTTYYVKKGWSDKTFNVNIVGWDASSVKNISNIKISISGFYYSFDASSSSYTATTHTLKTHTTLYAVWKIQ